MIGGMNDELRPVPPDRTPPPDVPPAEESGLPPPGASPGEEVPEWLQRIRMKRALEQHNRRQRELDMEILRATAHASNIDDLDDEELSDDDKLSDDEELSGGEPVSGAPGNGADAAHRPAASFPPGADIPAPGRQPAPPSGSAGPAPPSPSAPPGDEPPGWVQALEAMNETEAEPVEEMPAWLAEVMAEEARQKAAPALFPAAPPASAPAAEASSAPPAAAPETAEQRRIQRRRERRNKARKASAAANAFQSLAVVVAAAALIATIFTFWTPASFLSEEAREGLRPAYATLNAQSPPTPIPTPIWMRRIGIVSGHWGPHPSTGRSDPGAVCPDGLTEAEVNRSVAQLVAQELSGRGYDVDLLDEWDPRLEDYQASVLISIHADSCHEFELPGATGFKVAPPTSRTSARTDDLRLQQCLITRYGEITGMSQHPSLTRDMTEYHNFREISGVTPAAIIELGFLFEDREMLENHPDVMAAGIVSGILCFLENAPPTPLPEVTPWPTIEATPTPLATPGLS